MSAAGAVLGLTLGRYFVDRCTGTAPTVSWEFDGTDYPGDEDFNWRDYFEPEDPAAGNDPVQTETAWATFDEITDADTDQDTSAPLNWLWLKAAAEWTDLIDEIDEDGDGDNGS